MFKKSGPLTAWMMILSFCCYAQDWHSPEVEQLYRQARTQLSQGSLENAIELYKQAIRLEPEATVLYHDLGQALLASKKPGEAYTLLEPVLASERADESIYQMAAAALTANNQKKKAKTVLEKGIARFTHSGILFHDLGNYYADNNQPSEALTHWLQGIEAAPSYRINYFEAAQAYSFTSQPIWTILYGEIFLNMEGNTDRSDAIRTLVLEGYKKLFRIEYKEIPAQKAGKTFNTDFEQSVIQNYLKQAAVVADGFNVENLIMLRARFIMDWKQHFTFRYPFSLFLYQDKMLRQGQFDVYNQWLLGRAENEAAYNAWIKFNPQALPKFESWVIQNPFLVTASDFYNDKNVSALFPKKRKR